jgi:hypothetical protein
MAKPKEYFWHAHAKEQTAIARNEFWFGDGPPHWLKAETGADVESVRDIDRRPVMAAQSANPGCQTKGEFAQFRSSAPAKFGQGPILIRTKSTHAAQ